MIIIRTSSETIDKVVQQAKHALRGRPKLSQGELILIAETKKSLPPQKKPIQYRMEFEKYVFDKTKESIEIWGKYWNYIIIGRNCRALQNPFDICNVIKNPRKDYGRGGSTVYVDKDDEDFLLKNGYLD